MSIGDLRKDGYTIIKDAISQDDIREMMNLDCFHEDEECGFENRLDVVYPKTFDETNESINLGSKTDFRDFYFEGGGVRTQQRFSSYTMPWQTISNSEIESKIKKVLKDEYPEEIENGYYGQYCINMYLQGDFISKHDDGVVEDRFCVVLVPMNDRPEEVDKFNSSGGDLILYPDSDNVGIQVESKVGDIVILDFKHQLELKYT